MLRSHLNSIRNRAAGSRYYLSALVLGAGLMVGCGSDDDSSTPNCGEGTVLQGDQCVPVQDTTTPQDTTAPVDTTTQQDTTAPVDTTQPETAEEVVSECTPEEAGVGPVGFPCTRDCECQTVNGAPLICYSGEYLSGFSFCTDFPADRSRETRLEPKDQYGVEVFASLPSGCFPQLSGPERSRVFYVPTCNTAADCPAAAYTECGTGDAGFAWAGAGGTECPTSANAGATLSLRKVCIIPTAPPFDGSYVQ